jgi:SAM-dependent methyltransferase
MHKSALSYGKLFFDVYAAGRDQGLVVDIGAQDVNGSLKDVCPSQLDYCGVDFVAAKGVDIVITDPYHLPFEDGSVDIVICSSCFEHSEMFWLLYLEILRILKPTGLLYLNVPSNGYVHRYPVDAWRFYPDSGRALVTWGQRSGFDPMLLESFIGDMAGTTEEGEGWNDFVAVFLKSATNQQLYPRRMMELSKAFSNGLRAGSEEFINPFERSQDQRIITELRSALVTRMGEHAAEQERAAQSRQQIQGELDTARRAHAVALDQSSRLAVELQQARADLLQQQHDLRLQQHELQQIRSTVSWKITSPLRRIRSLLRSRGKM